MRRGGPAAGRWVFAWGSSVFSSLRWEIAFPNSLPRCAGRCERDVDQPEESGDEREGGAAARESAAPNRDLARLEGYVTSLSSSLSMSPASSSNTWSSKSKKYKEVLARALMNSRPIA